MINDDGDDRTDDDRLRSRSLPSRERAGEPRDHRAGLAASAVVLPSASSRRDVTISGVRSRSEAAVKKVGFDSVELGEFACER